MIYCCQGIGKVISAPCKCCGEACKCCEDFFKPILDSPLGCFVVITWIVMLIQCACGVMGMLNGGCGSVKFYSIALSGLAFVHGCFAYYLQRRLVTNLQKSGSAATGQALAKEAGRMFLYDVGFCIFIIVFVISFFFGLFCMSQLTCDGGEKSNSTFLMCAALVQIFHCIGAFNYAMCWYFGNCCLGGMGGGSGGGFAQQQPVQGQAVGMQR